MNHPYLASLIFGKPLAIEENKLNTILFVMADQFGIVRPVLQPGQLEARSKSHTGAPNGVDPKIAVIEVFGSLVHRSRGMNADSELTSYEQIGNALTAAARDSTVSGILLHIDSPGGEVAGAFPLATLIGQVAKEKPVWAAVDESAWSAGYLIASQANRVLLSENGSAGSVGIKLVHLDQSERDEQMGLKYTVLTRGKRKGDFDPHAPLSKDATAWADKLLDHEYDKFVEAVVMGRGLKASAVRGTEAEILFGEDAIKAGFADGFSSYRDAVGELLQHGRKTTASAFHKGGLKMAEEQVPAPIPPAAPPPTAAAPPVEIKLDTSAQEIAELCVLAGKAHLCAEFIQAKVSVADVRKRLLAEAAAKDEALVTNPHIEPRHGADIHAKPKETLAANMARRLGMAKYQEAR